MASKRRPEGESGKEDSGNTGVDIETSIKALKIATKETGERLWNTTFTLAILAYGETLVFARRIWMKTFKEF